MDLYTNIEREIFFYIYDDMFEPGFHFNIILIEDTLFLHLSVIKRIFFIINCDIISVLLNSFYQMI